ncbi:MAG: endonuclease domain-containing protein [Chloroflexi bacterium]|nr:endonuclease domain-containing protein [Chloroflexota bacterium]
MHFRRQHVFGPYITDFCAPSQKLVIEVDGSRRLDQDAYDAERTAFLESKGYRVLRFWNSDALDRINDVMGVILEGIESGRTPGDATGMMKKG